MHRQYDKNARLRTESERFDMITEAASFIGVGGDRKTRVSDVVAQLWGYRRQEQSDDAFKKDVERLCKRISDESADDVEQTGLIRLAANGCPTYYYWSDADSQLDFIEKFTITTPRAFALNFLKQHVAAILPKSLFSQLDEDFLLAERKLKYQGINLSDILDFSPFGLSMPGGNDSAPVFDTDAVNVVFEAIVKQQNITFSYDSIHSGYSGDLLISPQKLRFLSGQIQVLGLVHADQRLKHFALRKMQNVVSVTDTDFIAVKLTDYQHQRKLVIRCHGWVKDILTESQQGTQWQVSKVNATVWQLATQIAMPKHFQSDNDDCFYIANYLSMFADSLQVLEPASVKQEMQRRIRKQASLYDAGTSEAEALTVLTNSPLEIANPVKEC